VSENGYWGRCAADFTFHVPGRNQLSGSYRGHDPWFALMGKAMTLAGGQFEEIVEDVPADDIHAVVLVRHHFPRNGQPKEYRSAHVYGTRDGQVREGWEQPHGQALVDDGWA
jgi:ketosteroid isomerase-like protein